MIVLDASAWVEMLLGTAHLPDPSEEITVPPHFDTECLGTIRGLQQRGVLSAAETELAVELHLGLHPERSRDEADIRRAWAWREDLSFADGWYAALAQRLDGVLVTADRKAARAASRLGVACLLVG